MKLRDYFDPTKSQTYTKISAPLADKVSFRINCHILQLLPTFYERFDEEPNEFLEEFTNTCMTYNYRGVSEEHLKRIIFSVELKIKPKSGLDV